ncbi:MAG TPA: hypothetical protein PL048_14330, partial [Leptospiraceae bacterium]|nr:hypothetical protein [Leptospiraceae bacterium]
YQVENTMNIKNAVDKAYENKSFKELADAPVAALEGISDAGAEDLQKRYKVKTIRDLANLKVFHWAQAIVTLADTEV